MPKEFRIFEEVDGHSYFFLKYLLFRFVALAKEGRSNIVIDTYILSIGNFFPIDCTCK